MKYRPSFESYATRRIWSAVVALGAVILLSAAPATASVRFGTADDPMDQQPPSLSPEYQTDLAQVAVTYDDSTGTVTASATFYQAEDHIEAAFTLNAGLCAEDSRSASPDLALNIDSDLTRSDDGVEQDGEASATLTGYEGSTTATPTVSSDGRTITATVSNVAFQNRNWACISGFGTNGSSSGSEDDFRSFYFKGYDPTQACNRYAASRQATDLLLPYAKRHYRRYYVGLVGPNDWELGRWYCTDLTGDGHPELVAQMLCCTGGSLSPWAIFKRNPEGSWKLAYAQIRETVFFLRLQGHHLRAITPEPYEGACTTRLRDWIVRWQGSRFRGSFTRPYRIRRGDC